MINIYNGSREAVLVLSSRSQYTVAQGGHISLPTDNGHSRLSFTSLKRSWVKNVLGLKCLGASYHFSLLSTYEIEYGEQDVYINLSDIKKMGDNRDYYDGIAAQINGTKLLFDEFCVADNNDFKKSVIESEADVKKWNKRASIVHTTLDVILTAIPILVLAVPLIIYCGINTALSIVIPICAIALAIGLLLRSIVKKGTNKLEKAINRTAVNIPFYGLDSYFEPEYIRFVIKNGCNY